MLFFLLILAGGILLFRKIPLLTSDGAIIMALGILTNVFINQKSPLAREFGPWITLFVLALLLALFCGYLQTRSQRESLRQQLKDVLPRFGIGTWVAAVSVTVTVLSQQWKGHQWMDDLLIVLYGLALCIWVGYLSMILPGFREIARKGLYDKVHGGILLSCVATQSLVIGLNFLPGGHAVPAAIEIFFIITGSVFYGTGIVLIIRRYIKDHSKSALLHWPNTNCIIHGAMSITGLASAVSGSVSPRIIAVIWLYAVTAFFLVEGIEGLRMVQRVKHYGIQKGLFVYDPTQWARIFTFGMLVMFSMKAPLSLSFLSSVPMILSLREAVIQWVGWIVFFLFVIEVSLFSGFCRQTIRERKRARVYPKAS